MPNITVTHADSGVVQTRVARTERVTPHMHRVTFAGGDLDTFVPLGFDQWFRLAIPVHDGDRLDKVPSKFTFGTLIKFMAMPKGSRPTIRNFTVGESALIKGVRRHLVNDCGVPKANVTFSGYWKIGKSAPS